jgi:hypothetical protein
MGSASLDKETGSSGCCRSGRSWPCRPLFWLKIISSSEVRGDGGSWGTISSASPGFGVSLWLWYLYLGFMRCFVCTVVPVVRWQVPWIILKNILDNPYNHRWACHTTVRACSVSSQSTWIEWDCVGLNPN